MIVVRKSEPGDFDGFYDCLGMVAKESRNFTFVNPLPRENSRSYFKDLIDSPDGVHISAHDGHRFIGWCDISRSSRQCEAHVGKLGMAVAADYRGQGVGRRLMTMALDDAEALGMWRITLGVLVDNHGAAALYHSLGFVREGREVASWHFEGETRDAWVMARVKPPKP